MAEIKRFTCGDLRLIPYSWPDGEWVLYSDHLAAIKAAVAAEREAVLQIVSTYPVPVGNSSAGEMACDWTMDALQEVAAKIRARGAAHD